MNTRLHIVALSAILFAIGSVWAQPTADVQTRHEQMLYTAVRVRSGNVGGSGTVWWSGQDTEGKWHTYILTNHHVIENAVTVEKKWSPLVARDIKKETRSTVTVEFFAYNDMSRVVGQVGVEADIVLYDAERDLAWLETRDRESPAKYIARLFPHDGRVYIYDKCFAVGAALGHAPITTEGMIVFLDDEIEDQLYWMSTAQIIYGNSGGAIFRPDGQGNYQFLGVPSRVAVAQSGFSSTVATHMGYFVPIPEIYDFLEAGCYDFVWNPRKTMEQCTKEREAKREKERFLAWPVPEEQESPSVEPPSEGPGPGPK